MVRSEDGIQKSQSRVCCSETGQGCSVKALGRSCQRAFAPLRLRSEAEIRALAAESSTDLLRLQRAPGSLDNVGLAAVEHCSPVKLPCLMGEELNWGVHKFWLRQRG